jgi:hypothetical protein
MSESIVKAALLHKGVVFTLVLPGARHNHLFQALSELGILSNDDLAADTEQGFVTSDGRYVGRQDAVQLALAAGQIPEARRELFTEDLW